MAEVFIHPSAIIDEGARLGTDTRVWHFTHIMPRAVVGSRCVIGQNVFIDNCVEIGNGVKIQNNVSVYNGVKIEDDVFVGPSVVFTNVINPRSFIERKQEFKQTIIERGATIGANATIICGITVGAYAFIGAGSVATKDVAPFSVVYGNPATPKGWISKAGYPLVLNTEGQGVCSKTGVKYFLKNGIVQIEDKA